MRVWCQIDAVAMICIIRFFCRRVHAFAIVFACLFIFSYMFKKWQLEWCIFRKTFRIVIASLSCTHIIHLMEPSTGENLGLEFTELRPGLAWPSMDAIWLKAPARLEMAVRYKHREIQVRRTRGGPGFDRIYKEGSIACDGCCVYRPPRGAGPELYFRNIQKKTAEITCMGSKKSGELACQIICGRTGDELGCVALPLEQTLSFAKKTVADFLQWELKLIGKTVLEIRTFKGKAGHAKLKSIFGPTPSTKKRKKQHTGWRSFWMQHFQHECILILIFKPPLAALKWNFQKISPCMSDGYYEVN